MQPVTLPRGENIHTLPVSRKSIAALGRCAGLVGFVFTCYKTGEIAVGKQTEKNKIRNNVRIARSGRKIWQSIVAGKETSLFYEAIMRY